MIRRLWPAILSKCAVAVTEAVAVCRQRGILPEGFLKPLLERYNMSSGVRPASSATPAQPCQGCGGAKYRPEEFNRPGGADELMQQLG